MVVNGDRGRMSVRDRPDDILRAPGGVAAEEDARLGRLHRGAIDDRHPLLVEVDADVALHPGESVLLADGDNHIVAGNSHRVDHFAGLLSILFGPLEPLELHRDELAVGGDEGLGRVVLDDVDAFFFSVLELPGRRLEVLPHAARHDFHILAAQSPRGAAAVHGGVADTDDQDALADLLDVAEVRRGEPLYSYMYVSGRLLPAWDVEILAGGGAAADEDGVVAL